MRIRKRRSLPAMCASTSCSLSRTTRNMVFGRASVTSPSTSIASSFCFVARTSPFSAPQAPPSLREHRDGRGLRALLTLSRLVRDSLPLLEVPVPRPLDLGEVDEKVLAAVVRRDEPIALLCGEPLHDTLGH